MGKELPVRATREELKKDAARDEWEKLIAQGWRRTLIGWKIKRVGSANH